MDKRQTGQAGTTTFLFTDIEGSTRLVQALGERYPALLAEHRQIMTAAIESAGGRVFGTEGDALFIAFTTARAAVVAAAEAQRALLGHGWPADGVVRVRMGIHTGEALLTGGDYVGLALHQAARITSAGHGGQVLVSDASRSLIEALPAGLELRDLGERRLKDLAAPERLYQIVGDGLPDSFPPLRTLDTRTNNLPVQLTSFVGRNELAAARARLAETRLLTLSGPGGTGKTRLALQLAAEVSDEFPDGVFFVGLDSVREPGLVPAVVASAIGLTVSGAVNPLDAVIEHLRDRTVLLVLDNFEQVVDAAIDVSRLLGEARDVKVIVTTRTVLRIYGEQEFPVPPLGLPAESVIEPSAEEAAGYEAVRLFVERAMAIQPSFMLTDENAPTILEIVRRLDGLPLAIELAAARTRVLPVSAIRGRLDQHLALLTGGARDLPARQQTLRGAIDWSYDLLDPPDQKLFERFSVHAGGAFLTQADAVCGPRDELGEDVLDGLSSLSEKSLVRAALAADEDPRFAMLATIRDYARERLAGRQEHETVARRHALAYLGLVEAVADRLTGRDAARLSDRLELDHDNLRAALDWAVEHGETEIALRFITAVWRFWQTRGHLDEGRRRVDAILELPGIDELSPVVRARAYGAAGGITYWQGDTHATHEHYAKALAAARESGDMRLIGPALYNFGFAPLDIASPTDELYAAGMPVWEESLAIFRELGDEKGIADASWALAIGRAATGEDMAGAIVYAEEALEKYRRLEDPFGTGWGSYMIAGLRSDERAEVIEPYLHEALTIFRTAHDRSGILLVLQGYSMLAVREGDPPRANRLGGFVERLRAETGAGIIDSPLEFMNEYRPVRPTDPEGIRLWEEGGRLTLDEAMSYALGESSISD